MNTLETLARATTLLVSGVYAGKARELVDGGQEVVALYRGQSHAVKFSVAELQTKNEDAILFKLLVQFRQFKGDVENELGADMKPLSSLARAAAGAAGHVNVIDMRSLRHEQQLIVQYRGLISSIRLCADELKLLDERTIFDLIVARLEAFKTEVDKAFPTQGVSD